MDKTVSTFLVNILFIVLIVTFQPLITRHFFRRSGNFLSRETLLSQIRLSPLFGGLSTMVGHVLAPPDMSSFLSTFFTKLSNQSVISAIMSTNSANIPMTDTNATSCTQNPNPNPTIRVSNTTVIYDISRPHTSILEARVSNLGDDFQDNTQELPHTHGI